MITMSMLSSVATPSWASRKSSAESSERICANAPRRTIFTTSGQSLLWISHRGRPGQFVISAHRNTSSWGPPCDLSRKPKNCFATAPRGRRCSAMRGVPGKPVPVPMDRRRIRSRAFCGDSLTPLPLRARRSAPHPYPWRSWPCTPRLTAFTTASDSLNFSAHGVS